MAIHLCDHCLTLNNAFIFASMRWGISSVDQKSHGGEDLPFMIAM